MKKRLFCLITALLLVLSAGCGLQGKQPDGGDMIYEDFPEGEITLPEMPTIPPEPTEITFLAAGDIMCHKPQLNGAKNSDGTYSFTRWFKHIKSLVSGADIAMANLETTLSGAERGYSTYPMFNTPDSIADAMVDCGFDIVSHANNHSYDKGLSGIIRTNQVLKEKGFTVIGTSETAGGAKYAVVDVQGIKLGLIAYADDLSPGTNSYRTINGIKMTTESLDYINTYNPQTFEALRTSVAADVAACRQAGADMIIAFFHWGVEYQLTHHSFQQKTAQMLCDEGVDVIIGSHPHVPQDSAVLTSTDGTRQTLCWYSLGNLVSNQCRDTLDYKNAAYTETGMIVTLTIRKTYDGICTVSAVEQTPTYVHRFYASGRYLYEIVPAAAAAAAPAQYGLTQSSHGTTRAKQAAGNTARVVGNAVPAALVKEESVG